MRGIRICFLLAALVLGLSVYAGGVWAADPVPPAQGAAPPAGPASAAAPASSPKLKIAETKFDFGKVKIEVEVNHDFVIENMGSGDLVIDSVTPG
jgi:hypothetical protein